MNKKQSNYNCIICNKEFYLKPFHTKRYKGPFCCSRACRSDLLKDVYRGNKNPNYKYDDSVKKFLSVRCKDISSRAKIKNINFNLTPEYLYKLYLDQNGLCCYSGLPMKLGSTNFKTKGQADLDALSVDKIVPENGYTIGNIQLCCNAINKLKGNENSSELDIFLTGIGLKSFGTCKIDIKKLRKNANIPLRSKLGDGGFDVTAAKIEDLGNQIKVYTGISCRPSFGWILLAMPRSSIAKKGLMLSNSVGLIDNQYSGEIMAIFNKIDNNATIDLNERIIQLFPVRVPTVTFEQVDEFSDTERNEGGFGSTGK